MLTLEAAALLGASRVVESRARLQRVFEIEPDFWVAHLVQPYLLRMDGKHVGALQSLQRADQLSDGISQPAAALGYWLARTGQPEAAREVLARLQRLSQKRYVPPTSIGLIHAGLRDAPAAMASLEQGLAVRDTRMTLVKNDGRWKLVEGDARYRAVLQRLKLA